LSFNTFRLRVHWQKPCTVPDWKRPRISSAYSRQSSTTNCMAQ